MSGARLGSSVALVTRDLRSVLRHAVAGSDAGGGHAGDHGAMACRGVCGETVRMKTNRP